MSKRPINVEVEAQYKDENAEKLIRRFAKKIKRERIIEDFRERMYYEKPSAKRKRKEARRKKVLEKLRIEKENKEKIN